MGKIKKIILFIVEGITDEMSLSLILSKLIDDSSVQFHVINSDITSDFNSSAQNIIRKIDGEVKNYLSKNTGLRKTDIKEIIHLVDTDGAFVDEDHIIEDDSCEKTFYTENSIHTNKKDLIVSRNERKSSILNKLYQTNSIGRISYRIFFFSSNLEHVLHNNQNTPLGDKSMYSYRFVDKYVGDESQFIKFISSSDFAVKGKYRDTWKFIKTDLNSLNRYCNLHLFFKDNAHLS